MAAELAARLVAWEAYEALLAAARSGWVAAVAGGPLISSAEKQSTCRLSFPLRLLWVELAEQRQE